jgi:hypothetical protein
MSLQQFLQRSFIRLPFLNSCNIRSIFSCPIGGLHCTSTRPIINNTILTIPINKITHYPTSPHFSLPLPASHFCANSGPVDLNVHIHFPTPFSNRNSSASLKLLGLKSVNSALPRDPTRRLL